MFLCVAKDLVCYCLCYVRKIKNHGRYGSEVRRAMKCVPNGKESEQGNLAGGCLERCDGIWCDRNKTSVK